MSSPLPNLAQIADTMRTVAADCESDAATLDRTTFSPRGVGEAFGATLAMLAAVANAVAIVADDRAARP